MLRIRGTQDIYISRSDTANIGFNLIANGDNGFEDYEMADREYVVFRLWDKFFKNEITTARSEAGTSIIPLTPSLTENSGEYRYSVDLIYADGTKETVVGKSPNTAPKFMVMEA